MQSRIIFDTSPIPLFIHVRCNISSRRNFSSSAARRRFSCINCNEWPNVSFSLRRGISFRRSPAPMRCADSLLARNPCISTSAERAISSSSSPEVTCSSSPRSKSPWPNRFSSSVTRRTGRVIPLAIATSSPTSSTTDRSNAIKESRMLPSADSVITCKGT